jgi:K+-sensing histidine kinase KdpD
MDRQPSDAVADPDALAAARRRREGVPASRRLSGFAVAIVGLPVLTTALVAVRASISLDSVLLLYLLAVVVIAVIGGMLPALVAAVSSFLLANWFLTKPYQTFDVESRDSVIALVVFVVVATIVSLVVDISSTRLLAATRSRTEADLLARFAAQPAADTSPISALRLIQTQFGMDAVALVDQRNGANHVVVFAGNKPDPTVEPSFQVHAGGGLCVVGTGPRLFAEDRRMLDNLAATAARAWEGRELAAEAARSTELAAIDRLRSALLAAVGHDLRTPLAGIKAAVSSLRQHDVAWSASQQDELLATIEESADRLADLIANLLAMSRIEAGTVLVDLAPTSLDEVVARAVTGMPAHRIELHVPEDLPMVLADPGLLERVVANLVDNAVRHEPPDRRVSIDAAPDDDRHVRLSVVDHGPGLGEGKWETMFAPFQRFDDRAVGTGLGLAIARGFSAAMDATVAPSNTEGGGLTMAITLPVAP